MSTELEEKKMLASKLFILAAMRADDKELFNEKDFIHQVLSKKMAAYEVPVEIPTWLTTLIGYCCNGNPGISQLILHDLFESINENKFHGEGITAGYVITTTDFGFAFPTNFPIVEIPEVNEKYDKMWDAQKYRAEKINLDANMVDTLEYWSKLFKQKTSEEPAI